MIISRFIISAALVSIGASTAFAINLNVWLEPSIQSGSVGSTVSVDVYVNAVATTPLAISDAYLAFTWDPTVLQNSTPTVRSEAAPWSTSYWAPGVGVNTNLQDGDAQRELLGELPPNFPVAPIGVMGDPLNRLKVISLDFQISALSAPTPVRLWGTHEDATTNFLRGNFGIGEWNLVFEHGSYAEAWINPVPEPATMSILALGLGALIRRRPSR